MPEIGAVIAVSINPGLMQFTRTPRGARSTANCRVNPTTPCLLAVYAPAPGNATSPNTDARLMIDPLLRAGLGQWIELSV